MHGLAVARLHRENAGRAWPDRGSNHSGIAEIWLRQGRKLTEALARARQAVEIDRNATGIKKEALDTRLGEDLVVLAWAVAANSGDVREVESLRSEAFPLCGTKTTPVLGQIHYHAGKAYEALKMPEKSHEHFRQATELDPHGTWGHLSQASLSSSYPSAAQQPSATLTGIVYNGLGHTCPAFSNGAFFLADSDPGRRKILFASIIPVHNICSG